MKHLVKQHPWECQPYAWSMVLGIEPTDLYQIIGHDGSDIIFPQLPDPMCRRGVHVNECVNVALRLDYTASPLELISQFESNDRRQLYRLQPLLGEFDYWIHTARGVLEGDGPICRHAVAFDRGQVYDPDGDTYPWSFQQCESRGFYGKRLWIVKKV